jgi:hypothetical protein
MADLAQLEQALIKADQAGNADDARAFAAEIRRMRTEQPSQQAQPAKYDEQAELRKQIEAEPYWKQMLLAGGAGAVKTALGAKQLVSPLTEEQQGAVQAATTAQEVSPWAGAAGDIATMVAPGVGAAGIAAKAPILARMLPSTTIAAEAVGGALMAPKTLGQAAAGGAGYLGLQPTQGAEADLGERAIEAGKGAALGTVGYGAAKGIGRVLSPQTSPEVLALQKEGITPTAGQILGGGFKKAEEAARSVPILGDVITRAQKKGIEDFNRAAINRALNPIGQKITKDEPVGYKAVDKAYQQISGAYDDLLPKLNIKADEPFVAEINNLRQMATNLNPDQAKQFEAIIKNEVESKFTSSGIMSGETMKQIESKLGQLSRNYMRDPDYDKQLLGNALQETQATLRKMVERNNPKYAGQLSKVNEAYANLLRVENAAAQSGAKEGVFTPAQLERASRALDPSLRKRASAHGGALMQDLATQGQTVLAQQLPESGTAPRLMYGLGGLGAGGAYLTGGLGGLAATGAGLGLGSALYTQPAQRAIASLLTSRPELARTAGNRLADLAGYGALGGVGAGQLIGNQ